MIHLSLLLPFFLFPFPFLLILLLVASFFLLNGWIWGAGYEPTKRSVRNQLIEILEERFHSTKFVFYDLGSGFGGVPIDVEGRFPNAFCAALLLLGCTVGPDYQRPAALGKNPLPSVFAEAKSGNPGKWKQASPSAHLPRGAWWKIFGDGELNRIEAQATADNQTLAGFVARFDQARALVNVSRADWFPQVAAAPDINRQHTSANLLTAQGNTFTT